MSQSMQQQNTFHFPEQLELDGSKYSLVYDPGNPERPQVMPNYKAMFIQPSSDCYPLSIQGMEQAPKYFAVVDAVMPPLTAQQAGGFPVPEKRYLCLKLEDYKKNPAVINPAELVIYERRQSADGDNVNRGQRLLNAILGSAAAAEPKPDTQWTSQMAQIKAMQEGPQEQPEAAEHDKE